MIQELITQAEDILEEKGIVTFVFWLLSLPFRSYWEWLDRIVFFFVPNLIKWVLTILIILTTFRGLLYYQITGDPIMPTSFGNIPSLPGYFPTLWVVLTSLVLLLAFLWSYMGLKGMREELSIPAAGKGSKNILTGRKPFVLVTGYPAHKLALAWFSLLAMLALGWTMY